MEATTILSLLDSASVALKAINELTQDYHHAPKDIASLGNSLQSLMGILDSMVNDNTTVTGNSCRKHSPSFQALIAIGV